MLVDPTYLPVTKGPAAERRRREVVRVERKGRPECSSERHPSSRASGQSCAESPKSQASEVNRYL